MTEAVKAMLKYIFTELNLQRVDGNTYAENEASIKVLKKVGFKYEGIRKRFKRCFASKKIHDVKMFGLLKEDWEKMSKV